MKNKQKPNAKRREKIQQDAKLYAQQMIESGRLIESGFLQFHMMTYPNGSSFAERDRLRMAFFGGAQHLLGAMAGTLDIDSEITEADDKRMAMIQAELDVFIEEFKKAYGIDDPDIGPDHGGERH